MDLIKLYELVLHFPDTYGITGNEALTLESSFYCDSDDNAVSKAQAIAEAFVSPRPDFWYVSDAAVFNIWTDSPAQTKQAIHYDRIKGIKPNVIKI